jgi:hypothetical protein
MNDDEELPAWISILEQGPLDCDQLNQAKLKSEFEIRIPALLESYGADNALDGWRDVAIQLAIKYHPALMVQKKPKIPVSGRPVEDARWGMRQAVLSRRRKLQREAAAKGLKQTRLDAESARQINREWSATEDLARRRLRGKDQSQILKTPSVKTLQNLLNQKVTFSWNEDDYLFDAFHLARKVALKLPPVK